MSDSHLPTSSSIRVLHVEDEALYSFQLKICLDELGYAMLGPAVDAEQAMGLFATTEPDLVVLDIGLSGPVDGITLASRMRALRPSVPLLFVTSFTDRGTFERARAVGPLAYISKPFTVPTVQHAIELAVQQANLEPVTAYEMNVPGTFVMPAISLPVQSNETAAAAAAAAAANSWPEDVLARDAFFVKNRDRLLKIYQHDVLAIEASNGLTVLRTINGGQYLLSITLGKLEEKLVGTSFARVHRTWLVNVSMIDEVLLSQSAVRLGALLVPLSTGHRPMLMRRLQLLT